MKTSLRLTFGPAFPLCMALVLQLLRTAVHSELREELGFRVFWGKLLDRDCPTKMQDYTNCWNSFKGKQRHKKHLVAPHLGLLKQNIYHIYNTIHIILLLSKLILEWISNSKSDKGSSRWEVLSQTRCYEWRDPEHRCPAQLTFTHNMVEPEERQKAGKNNIVGKLEAPFPFPTLWSPMA